MTAPTREEVASGLRSAAKSTQVSLAFGAMADYVLSLLADDRDRCAKECEYEAGRHPDRPARIGPARDACLDCAAAIRALGGAGGEAT